MSHSTDITTNVASATDTNTPHTSAQQSISSIARGPRQSNMELLRIVAMMMVLMVHANYFTINVPTAQEYLQHPANAWMRTFMEMACLGCVNVFILISGWFGIRPSVKGFCNFCFQCIFITLAAYLFWVFAYHKPVSPKLLFKILTVAPINWFVGSYILLYLLSPILNAFLEKASRRQLETVLITFYIFQTLASTLHIVDYFQGGYSTLSFIGLYLLARYIKLFGNQWLKWGGVIFTVCVALQAGTFGLRHITGWPIMNMNYDNPLCVGAACGLLMLFARLRVRPNRTVNWVARSAFAVFLLHMAPGLHLEVYKPLMNSIYLTYSGLTYFVVMGGALLAIYLTAILLDQPRQWLWRLILHLTQSIKCKVVAGLGKN